MSRGLIMFCSYYCYIMRSQPNRAIESRYVSDKLQDVKSAFERYPVIVRLYNKLEIVPRGIQIRLSTRSVPRAIQSGLFKKRMNLNTWLSCERSIVWIGWLYQSHHFASQKLTTAWAIYDIYWQTWILYRTASNQSHSERSLSLFT